MGPETFSFQYYVTQRHVRENSKNRSEDEKENGENSDRIQVVRTIDVRHSTHKAYQNTLGSISFSEPSEQLVRTRRYSVTSYCSYPSVHGSAEEFRFLFRSKRM